MKFKIGEVVQLYNDLGCGVVEGVEYIAFPEDVYVYKVIRVGTRDIHYVTEECLRETKQEHEK